MTNKIDELKKIRDKLFHKTVLRYHLIIDEDFELEGFRIEYFRIFKKLNDDIFKLSSILKKMEDEITKEAEEAEDQYYGKRDM